MGESHKTTGKPCQDYSVLFSDEESGIYIAIVCDGHGGERYFRSDRGSRFLAEIARDTTLEFIQGIPGETFSGQGLVQAGPGEHPDGYGTQDAALRRLFSSIIFRWQKAIEDDVTETPLAPEELKGVKPEHVKAFQEGKDIEKAYGSTLMAFFQTAGYWVAFHIGDGHCIMFTADGRIIEPVPWDERCFLNSTTSICDRDALGGFRYAWQGGDSRPFAVFLGTDGLDDSFGDGDRLHTFYLGILRSLVEEGEEATKQSLVEALPDISARGSQDDMSISFVYDEQLLEEKTREFAMKQLSSMRQELEVAKKGVVALESKKEELSESYSKIQEKIQEQEKADAGIKGRIARIRRLISRGEQECSSLDRKREDLESSKSSLTRQGEKTRIELKYATNDLVRARDTVSGINLRIEAMEGFLGMRKVANQEDEASVPEDEVDKGQS